MKENIFSSKESLARALNRFFASRLYVIFIMAIIFIGQVLAIELPIATLAFVVLILGFLFADDLKFLIPILLGGICIVSLEHTPFLPSESDYLFTVGLPFILVLALILVGGITVFAFRNRRTAAPFSSLRLKWGFIGFFAVMLLAGLFEENALKNLAFGAGMGIGFVGVYLLFGFFHPKTKENAEHFLFTLLSIGLLVSAELLVVYLRSVAFENGFPVKSTVLIGWGTWANIGAMLGMCLPAPFYLARTEKRGYALYLAAGGVMTVALLFSASRASWLYGGVVFALSLLLLALGGEHRKKSRILICALFGIGVLSVLLLLPKILAFLSAFVHFGDGDNGRFAIWGTAVRSFLAAPVFGRGFFNTDIVLDGFPEILPYMYHNTPLQMLGSAGAVGLLVYLYHRAETLYLLFQKRKSVTSLFLLLVPFSLVLFSITDEHFFHIYPAFFYAVALSLAEGEYADEPLVKR